MTTLHLHIFEVALIQTRSASECEFPGVRELTRSRFGFLSRRLLHNHFFVLHRADATAGNRYRLVDGATADWWKIFG